MADDFPRWSSEAQREKPTPRLAGRQERKGLRQTLAVDVTAFNGAFNPLVGDRMKNELGGLLLSQWVDGNM